MASSTRDLNGIEIIHARHKDTPMRLVEVEPLFFRTIDGKQRVSFRRPRDGKRLYLFDLNFQGDIQFVRISEQDLTTKAAP